MSRAWDDLGGSRETYEQALARSLVNQREPELTEQERADKIVAGRERLRQHDAYFADGFLPVDEQRQVSLELARQFGFTPHQSRELPDGQMPDDDGIGNDA